MDTRASVNYLRISSKKVRLVTRLIVGLDVAVAEHQLSFVNKRSSKPVLKLLKSVVANAQNNFKLEKSNLYIKEVLVNEGPTLKRWKPRAFGRATPIRKRSSHITIILSEKVASPEKKKESVAPKILAKPTVVSSVKEATATQESEAPAAPGKAVPAKTESEQKTAAPAGVISEEKKFEPSKKESASTAKTKKGFLRKIFSRKAI